MGIGFEDRLNAALHGQQYDIRITRSATGVFTSYIKGGAFADWTLIDPTGGSGTNPVTDNTHTTSCCATIDMDAGDTFHKDEQYAGVLVP